MNDIIFARIRAVLGWLSCGLTAWTMAPAQVLSEGDHFEVVADRLIDARRVVVVADRAGERLAGYLGAIEVEEGQIPGALPVRIVVDGTVDAGDSEVIWGAGQRQLICRIDARIFEDEEEFAYRITKAWLAQWTWVRRGEQAIAGIPDWFVSGLSLDVVVGRFPALPSVWADRLDGAERLSLGGVAAIDRREEDERGAKQLQAWVLLKAVMQGARNLSERAEVLDTLIQGMGAEAFVAERILGNLSVSDRVIEAWWQVTIDDYAWAPERSALPLHLSRFEVERLASWWSDEGGLPVWESAEKLLEQPVESIDLYTRAALQARILAIKLILPDANPLYVNALISLGRYYEAIDTGLDEQAPGLWAQFSQDWAFAQEVGGAAEAALQGR